MEWLLDPHAWLALATLTALEIVLGVDNIIFISILCGRLPRHQQARARTLGLGFAMLTRLGLLFSLTWLMSLTAPLFTVGKDISGRAPMWPITSAAARLPSRPQASSGRPWVRP